MAFEDDDSGAESKWLLQAASTPSEVERAAPPTPARLPRPGDRIADKYRVGAMIGRGGMGAVFEAEHELMQRTVAVKWLVAGSTDQDELRARLLREARAAARIRHPHVVDVYDVGIQDGALFLVMERLHGEPLSATLERGDLTIAEMLELIVQAMRGVAAAHAAGVVHRDVKPENIFVTCEPLDPLRRCAKVLDFGISKVSEDALGDGAHVTASGTIMGTPAYMSIEQLRGVRDIDGRADVYAFGVLMYRALTGRLPFDERTFASLAMAVVTQTPPSPKTLRPDLPDELDRIVRVAMARERQDRYPSMAALLAELDAIDLRALESLRRRGSARAPAVASAASDVRAPDRGAVRWRPIALGVAVLAALTLAWAFSAPDDDPAIVAQSAPVLPADVEAAEPTAARADQPVSIERTDAPGELEPTVTAPDAAAAKRDSSTSDHAPPRSQPQRPPPRARSIAPSAPSVEPAALEPPPIEATLGDPTTETSDPAAPSPGQPDHRSGGLQRSQF